jgi:hypothetical protein
MDSLDLISPVKQEVHILQWLQQQQEISPGLPLLQADSVNMTLAIATDITANAPGSSISNTLLKETLYIPLPSATIPGQEQQGAHVISATREPARLFIHQLSDCKLISFLKS